MGLRYDPIGGGQFKQAVKQIIEAEGQPIRQLETRKAREEAKIKLFQDFKSRFTGMNKAIRELQGFQRFRELKVDLGDGAQQVSVTVDKDKAQPGTYEIEIAQLAKRTAVITNGFESADEANLGVGFIQISPDNGETFEIFVDEENASLRGIANLINRKAESPIRAAVVNDAANPEAPWKMIFSSKKEGANSEIKFPEFYFLDGAQELLIEDIRNPENAVLQMDGFPIETASNDVNDFLPGINLHLKQAKPDTPFTMTITEDYQKITGKVKGLVEEMNKILEFIVKQNTIDEKTDTSTTFAGDTTLQNIEYKLRNLMHEGYPAGDPEKDDFRVVYLNELGVEFQKDGMLAFKEDRFQKMLEKDFDGISQAISAEYGFARQVQYVLDGFTRPGDGVLTNREKGLRARVKEIDSQIESKKMLLDRKSQAITEQFARLEASLSSMQRQSQSLAAMGGGGGGGGNMVAQLLGG